MSTLDLCRLCANFAEDTDEQKLFEESQRNLLRQVEDLTGLQLKFDVNLPQFICESCENEVLHSHEFRERIIRVQKHLAKAAEAKSAAKAAAATLKFEEEMQEILLPVNQFLSNLEMHDIEEIDEVVDDGEELFEEIDDDTSPDFENVVRVENEPLNADDSSAGSCYSLSFDYPEPDKETLATTESLELPPPKSLVDIKLMEKVALLIEANAKKKPKSRRIKAQPVVCEQCGKSFRSQCFLTRHLQMHTGEKPYVCEMCDRRFAVKNSLQTHIRTHTNERPFVCQQCGKGFSAKVILKNHMLTHTSERPFKCSVCNVAFSRKAVLKAHCITQTHMQNVEKQVQLNQLETHYITRTPGQGDEK